MAVRGCGVLDGIKRPIEMLGQSVPWLAKLLVELHLRPGERREGDAVEGQRPADEPDPATQGDDADQDLLLVPPAQGAFIELVDLRRRASASLR